MRSTMKRRVFEFELELELAVPGRLEEREGCDVRVQFLPLLSPLRLEPSWAAELRATETGARSAWAVRHRSRCRRRRG